MRAWAYFSCIITIRLIMFASAAILSVIGGFFVIRPCAQIASVLGQSGTLFFYPNCQPFFNGSAQEQVIVEVDFYSKNPLEISASLGISFGSAGWLAFWLHAIIIEVYLRLTPAESDRLKQVSYERQLAKGYKNPGAAGLSSQRFGDANPFHPEERKRVDEEENGVINVHERAPSEEDSEH